MKKLFLVVVVFVFLCSSFYIYVKADESQQWVSTTGVCERRISSITIDPYTPNTSYRVKDILVADKSVEVVPNYSFTNVMFDHTISAILEKQVTETVIILTIGSPNFTVNGEIRTLDVPPVIKNNRTLLPARPVIEVLGGTVDWCSPCKRVTISFGSDIIELWIEKPQARVNGVTKWIDETNHKVVPEIINGRTMIPLRFVVENLGATIDWDGDTKTITITY